MASAMLVSRNEPYWAEPKAYMRKNPNPNPNPKFFSSNPNPNPQIHASIREPDAAPQSVAVSSSSSSLRDSRFVTYNISTLSKSELRDLKRRLISELEQVRSVSTRIEARSARYAATSGIYATRPENASNVSGSESSRKILNGMMKKCSQILSKLMKHKGAIWFNTPVDVVGMGLHDYLHIIKTPMDLGTVRSKLSKGFYQNPSDFADDIRLTFQNALVYNPQGHEVHRLADQLLKHFEGMFCPPFAKFEKDQRSLIPISVPVPMRPVPVPMMRPESIPLISSPPMVQIQSQLKLQQQVVRRMPKPKAKDLEKRGMTTEEKEKLSLALDSLPEEKSMQVLSIIQKRRNVGMIMDGDVVEIDFEVMDNETLWELDRFVVNCEKAAKKKRVEEDNVNVGGSQMPDSSMVSAGPQIPIPIEVGDKSPAVQEVPESTVVKKSKKGGDPVDEDVDIGDDMPATNYPPIEIEKEAGNESGDSSSSSSGSSSSSDSDSGSSSGSDSDDDNAPQHPAVGSPRS